MSELKYTEDHAWARLDEGESKVAVVGISDYAQQTLGDVVYVELPEPGNVLGQGDEVALLESVKTTSSVKMPLTGEVLSINETLPDTPELINSDPLGDAWLMTISVKQPGEFADLMSEDAYQEFVVEIS